MKLIRKVIRISGLSLLVLFDVVFLDACASIPKLSKADKNTIRTVVKAPVPEIITGETGFAQSGNHKIWYEKIAPTINQKGTVLLIMGNGQDALKWPRPFITNLTEAGYEVVRYDQRDTGLSESKEKWKKKNPYTLNDMADDAVAVLNSVKIQKAHIVGVSMGGMIAQIIAIEHPERTASLTSIMSSGDILDSDLPAMSNEVLPQLISTVLKKGFLGNKKGQIKRLIIEKRILMGEATGTIDVKPIAEVAIYNLKKRNGYSLIAARHHFAAIQVSESRIEALKKVTTPTLIIHGLQDPLIPIEHGKKLAATIPNADSLWIENMGHDLPDAALSEITNKMISHFE